MRPFLFRWAGAGLLPLAVSVAVLLGLSGLPVLAGEPPVPIEGKLLVSGADDQDEPYAYFIEGSSENVSPAPVPFSQGDLSPLADQVVYDVTSGEFPTFLKEVWKADIDGSNPVNLTGPDGANLGGINCRAFWSPDGSQIAFHHCDPVEGLLPCEAGFEVWVMNADGQGAHRVTPEGGPTVMINAWSPNGYRLLCDMWGLGMSTMDVDGTDLEFLPNVRAEGDWSPDGSKIVSCPMWDDTVAGEPGRWRQLLLTNADGTGLQVLVEQFVWESDAKAHLARFEVDPNDPYELDSLYWNVGPSWSQFSPLGDRVAFPAAGLGAAFPSFDPEGPWYGLQNEVWIYELETGDLTKITDDLGWDYAVSWNGPNTFPDDPEVTVDNTTVTFSEVTDDGLTTIIRDDDPPELPGGYQFCGEYYDVSTTATVSSPITICITYEDEDVPGGNEEALALLHYNETTEEYEDITASRDTENNIVCGQVDQLSTFGLAAIETPVFGGFRPPINPEGSSTFKGGRTIPVKFTLFDPFGKPITYATAHLATEWAPQQSEGTVVEYEEAGSADVGNTFRYDEEEGQYIYNLSTKGMELGPRWLKVTLEGWPEFEASVLITLR